MKAIRMYVEGGGNSADTRAGLRLGLTAFLRAVHGIARQRRCKFDIIPCGSRSTTFELFLRALQDHPDAFNILLVDSEGPVGGGPWQHLQAVDGLTRPGLDDEQCHLMVQAMEAWFVADVNALEEFYGQGFQANRIPKNPDVEQIEKDRLEPALRDASRNTRKGPYHKTRHAPVLLERIDPGKVRGASAHCDRLFLVLNRRLA